LPYFAIVYGQRCGKLAENPVEKNVEINASLLPAKLTEDRCGKVHFSACGKQKFAAAKKNDFVAFENEIGLKTFKNPR
jgi:hypothetical protein